MQTVVFDRDRVSYQFALPTEQLAECGLFSAEFLEQNSLLKATVSGGRTEAFRFEWEGHDLLLKHYRRGGYVRHFTKDSYLWTGLHRTRAYKEFALLQTLHELDLPSPKPYACRVERDQWRYRASLITHWLPNTTSMTERVQDHPLPDRIWPTIGQIVRQFHDNDVCHEDLNSSNILIDGSDNVFIIDFDKALIKRSSVKSRQGKAWRYANLKRLQRSLMSLSVKSNAFIFTPELWSLFKQGYRSSDVSES